MENERGKFIVFEGIDGCGKSTQFFLFGKYLFENSKYNHVFLTREPYRIKEIREILKRDESPNSEAEKLAKLFVKDRELHLEEIILPTIESGHIVVSDRYKYSTIVYQSTQGLELGELIAMHKKMPVPDITFVVDLPAKLAKGRMESETKRSKEQKFENSVDFQEALRHMYLSLPTIFPKEKIYIIDGNRSIDEVRDEIREVYEREIKNWILKKFEKIKD